MKVKKLFALSFAVLLALFSCTVTYDEDVSLHRAIVSMQAEHAETIAPKADYADDAVPAFVTPANVTGEPGDTPDALTQDEPETTSTSPPETADTAQSAETTEAATEDAENYVIVPRFFNLNVAQALEYLASYGIDAKPDSDGAVPDAPVVVVSFYGKWDDENFYFIAGRDVTLKVGGVPDQPEPKDDMTPKGVKIAYLTFDDGPSNYNTYRILDILDSYGAKATFFVVGNAIERFPGRVKAISESGNLIACHSYSHNYADIYSSKDGFLDDMQRWYDAVYAELGEDYCCSLYRMPGGSACARRYAGYSDIVDELARREFRVFDWTMSNNDVWSRSKAGDLSPVEYQKKCFREQLEALDATGKPVIILMHETYDSTVEMLPWAIELLQSKGYSFDTLEGYIGEYTQR